MRPTIWLLAVVGLFAGGCEFKPKFNPNDPNQVSADRQPVVIQAYFKQMSDDVIGPAVSAAQITREKGDQMMVEGAKDYLNTIHLKDTPPNLMWMLGDEFITAHDWKRAKTFLEQALKVDTGPDRLVHDRVWFARCQAELGEVDEAIKTARSAFEAPPYWKWPILYAVIYEIVPAAEREKPSARLALAQLVKDSIKQHEAASGTGSDVTRLDYLIRRQYHINRAWRLVEELYDAANRPDLARAAAVEAIGNSKHSSAKAIQT